MAVISPYRDQAIALATMHAKERAIAKPFRRKLGASIVVAESIDTDKFGTFTGEISREGTMLEVARAKALAAIKETNLPRGLGSEGSFGPHPALPFAAAGMETIVFVDHERDITVHETLVTHRTNFSSVVCTPHHDIIFFLRQIGFPSHAVVVRPNQPLAPRYDKAIQDFEVVRNSIRSCAAQSRDGLALVVTEMRAHLNPTRMATIRALSFRLAARLAIGCPKCGAPGFGEVDVQRGLPCAWCRQPTDLAMAEIHRCSRCAFEQIFPVKNQKLADPGLCTYCNP